METASSQEAGRTSVYDVLKALGIISIVIGHCHSNQKIVDFVYSYHLALFLFVSGLQYNIKKYSTSPFYFLQNRIKSIWPSFFCYLTFFTITHDWFLKLHLVADGGAFGAYNIIFRTINNFIFLGGETLGGALWFIPVMLITMLLFSAVNYFAHTFFFKIRLIPILIFSYLIGALGVYCNLNTIQLSLHIHTGLLLLPVFTAGYLLTHFHFDYNKFFRWFIAIPCLFFVYYTVIKNSHRIVLSQELIGGSGIYFYTITFCGLYCIAYLAKVIDRIAPLSRIFVFFGKYTFDIMSLHFLIFKIIDIWYGQRVGDGPEIYSAFPCAYRSLWPIYVSASMLLSPWIRIGINKLITGLKKVSQHIWGV